MTCNYCFPTGTIIFQINSEFWKEGIFRWENRTSCLVGLKTHPTIVPRSGIELTTSRLHSFIMAKVSHALNHSAMEAELTTSRLHSFIVAKVSHALNHSAMEAELTTSCLHSFIVAKVSHALNHSAMEAELTTSRLHSFIVAKVSHALNHSAMEAELTTSRLHSFIVAKVSHALHHSAMEAELTTSRLPSSWPRCPTPLTTQPWRRSYKAGHRHRHIRFSCASVAEWVELLRVEALAPLGIPRERVQSRVAAGAKYGEFSSGEKSCGFSPEKRWSIFDSANHRGEAFDKLGL